ncbi:MAG: DNA repair protein RecO [Deltaproteobacteria bacterium]|nr:DNA repair protein RecO [Deltaproteobacteria bacterium]
MPEYRTRALVLRTFDQGESDRLVHLYTETLGRVSAIAKGARRSKRRFPGTLEILTLIEARIVDPPRSSLMRIEGAKLAEPFEGLVNDLGRYAVGCQLLEMLDRFTAEREASPELFRFAEGVLGVIARETPDRLLALLVQLKTLARLGFRPQLASCSVCGGEIQAPGPMAGFEPRHGGAVCASCREPGDTDVAPGLLLALEAGIRTPLRDRGQLGLGPGALRRALVLVDRFFRYYIGAELRTDDFLRKTLPLDRLDANQRPEDTPPTAPDPTGGDCEERVRSGSGRLDSDGAGPRRRLEAPE